MTRGGGGLPASVIGPTAYNP
ncbi:MAG: hypothetical protein QOJ12_2330, partial [Thermoleophilales bacterium]|nr:hypothetical protein [Thermoleophilales bacterium]